MGERAGAVAGKPGQDSARVRPLADRVDHRGVDSVEALVLENHLGAPQKQPRLAARARKPVSIDRSRRDCVALHFRTEEG